MRHYPPLLDCSQLKYDIIPSYDIPPPRLMERSIKSSTDRPTGLDKRWLRVSGGHVRWLRVYDEHDEGQGGWDSPPPHPLWRGIHFAGVGRSLEDHPQADEILYVHSVKYGKILRGSRLGNAPRESDLKTHMFLKGTIPLSEEDLYHWSVRERTMLDSFIYDMKSLPLLFWESTKYSTWTAIW